MAIDLRFEYEKDLARIRELLEEVVKQQTHAWAEITQSTSGSIGWSVHVNDADVRKALQIAKQLHREMKEENNDDVRHLPSVDETRKAQRAFFAGKGRRVKP